MTGHDSPAVMLRRAGGCALLAFFAAGCLNPNSYGTPRTTPVGQWQQWVAGEVVSFRRVTPAQRDAAGVEVANAETTAQNALTAPSFGLRYGLAERVDLGFSLANSSRLRLDLKYNFLRTDLFDMAVAPSADALLLFDGLGGDGFNANTYLAAPVLLALNASPEFSLVPSVGIGYAVNSNDSVYNNDLEDVATTSGLMMQAGLGLDFRTSDYFAVHPEMSLLRRLDGPAGSDMLWYTFGIGFRWGALPAYP